MGLLSLLLFSIISSYTRSTPLHRFTTPWKIISELEALVTIPQIVRVVCLHSAPGWMERKIRIMLIMGKPETLMLKPFLKPAHISLYTTKMPVMTHLQAAYHDDLLLQVTLGAVNGRPSPHGHPLT